MGRKRRVPASFDWTPVLDVGDTLELPDIHVRHSHVHLDPLGPSSSRTTFISAPASPSKSDGPSDYYDDNDYNWNNEPAPPEINTNDFPFLDPAYTHFLDLNEPGPPRRPRTIEDNPLYKWISDRDKFLKEFIRLDGRGDAELWNTCRLCAGVANIRCADCFGGEMFCSACMVDLHAISPFHLIEKWNGAFFESTTLKEIGLRIQLGHRAGDHCSNPRNAAGDDFVVVDSNGIHKVGLDYCGCEQACDQVTQLLRARLYPATTTAPKSAATFNTLEFFHLLSFESKASVFEFYYTLMRKTDNTGTTSVPDRYEEFLRMIREWRNLKMLKRAGRGHDPGGVMGTQEGECTVLCPACPHPGKNLPPGWRDAPEEIRWLYARIHANDANFRMVRKKVSSEAADPSLSHGWAIFSEVTKYYAHLAKYGDQPEERSTCVKHHAVKDANTKRSENLATTGIGTIDCARHNFKLPCSVGDLQKGEKYVNMDYLFLSSLKNTNFIRLISSYDIVCQWHVHLWERMLAFPGYLHIDLAGKHITFLVPKFHLPAHVASCQTAFSFNLTRGVGRTDGEAPERGWSDMNPLASQTKVMGPASRRETIDDHLNDWNHKKVIGLGVTLLRRLHNAVPGRTDHVFDFQEFTKSIPADNVLEWTKMVESWDKNNKETNPFVIVTPRISQHAVRLALAEEDAAELARDEAVAIHDDISPAMLIASGIDLETQQVRLKFDSNALDSSATLLQLAKIQERKNSLQRRIKAWTAIQHLYMPTVSVLRAREDRDACDTTAERPPQDLPLHLPSSLLGSASCSLKLQQYEFRLREAQAYEALENVRQHLRMRSHLYKHKDKNVTGQHANTRSRNLINRTQGKVNASAATYTRARNALAKLSGPLGEVGWRGRLLALKAEDIRPLKDGEDGDSEGTRKLSWIWKVVGITEDSNDEDVQEALRVEWCRSRARAMRWSEEVVLLREEMRRVLAFMEWHADWWEGRQALHEDLDAVLDEGMRAYAGKQAHIRRSMRNHFNHLWRCSDQFIALGIGADNEILDLREAASHNLLAMRPLG